MQEGKGSSSSERMFNDTKLLYKEVDRTSEFKIVLSPGGKETGKNSYVTELSGRQMCSTGQSWTFSSVCEEQSWLKTCWAERCQTARPV